MKTADFIMELIEIWNNTRMSVVGLLRIWPFLLIIINCYDCNSNLF